MQSHIVQATFCLFIKENALYAEIPSEKCQVSQSTYYQIKQPENQCTENGYDYNLGYKPVQSSLGVFKLLILPRKLTQVF